MAYRLEPGTFTNAVPTTTPAEADTQLMNTFPLRADTFWQSWQRMVHSHTFGSQPAIANLTVTDYQTTQTGAAYALSLAGHMAVHAPHVRPGTPGVLLASTPVRCSAVVPLTFADNLSHAWQQRRLNALTPSPQNPTMWQKALDQCISELAIPVANALAAAPR